MRYKNQSAPQFAIAIVCFLAPIAAAAFGTGPIRATYPLPSSYMDVNNISLGFCRTNDERSPPNIHTGIDIPVPSSTTVYSICDGEVYYDNTGADYYNSFLIVKHNCSGNQVYAYYGHISSTVNNPRNIKKSDPIGIVRYSPDYGDHLHLSINTRWDSHGWGYDYSCGDVWNEGYRDPLTYFTFSAREELGAPCSPYYGYLYGTYGYSIEPGGTYYYSGNTGIHTAVLSGPSGSDFDLYLLKWNWWYGWETVASSWSSSSEERIDYSGSSGFYEWLVYSYGGAGPYTLCITVP